MRALRRKGWRGPSNSTTVHRVRVVRVGRVWFRLEHMRKSSPSRRGERYTRIDTRRAQCVCTTHVDTRVYAHPTRQADLLLAQHCVLELDETISGPGLIQTKKLLFPYLLVLFVFWVLAVHQTFTIMQYVCLSFCRGWWCSSSRGAWLTFSAAPETGGVGRAGSSIRWQFDSRSFQQCLKL